MPVNGGGDVRWKVVTDSVVLVKHLKQGLIFNHVLYMKHHLS